MAPEGGGLRDAALAPPRALGGPCASALLRADPEDFCVDEQLGFEADAGSAHLLVRVEKRGSNTLWVARELARCAGVRSHDVGFAGLKDRHAVARQWFSLPRVAGLPELPDWAGEGWRVLEALPHSRKLRRGALRGNDFRLTLRELRGDLDMIETRLEALRARGAPNYFGVQRFGHAAANLARAEAWVAGGELPRGREDRAFVFSAARAALFNAVLALRVARGDWNRLLPGELANLDGSGSVFAVAQVDDELARRLVEGDIHPTGPLPGRPGLAPTGEAAALEDNALGPHGEWVARLAEAGLESERRALRILPRQLAWERRGEILELAFSLPRGAFATTIVRELVDTELPEREAD